MPLRVISVFSLFSICNFAFAGNGSANSSTTTPSAIDEPFCFSCATIGKTISAHNAIDNIFFIIISLLKLILLYLNPY